MLIGATTDYSHKHIVIIDDTEDNIFLLKSLLSSKGYHNLLCYTDPFEALKELLQAQTVPDIILLDIMMPKMNGIELCTKLRSDAKFEHTYVVFVTASHGEELMEAGFSAGGQDFLRKPYSKTELVCRLKNLFTMQDMHLDLSQKNQELTYASITDGLTGLYNRSFLDRRLSEDVEKSQRYQHKMAFMMMDIDHFKKVNDSHGHQVGDEVLINLATLLKHQLRASDFLARYGGEEIALIESGSNVQNAIDSAERIRTAVMAAFLSDSIKDLKITISIGIAIYEEGMNAKSLIEAADAALYLAKKQGRNRVCCHGHDREITG